MNTSAIDPEGASLVLMVSDLSGNTVPSLTLGGGSQTVIHATNIGSGTPATVTELPTTITPGVDANGNYYPPLAFIKSAWGE